MYLVTRYWDNDEAPEDFQSIETPIAIFNLAVNAIAYINQLSDSEILLDEAECFSIKMSSMPLDPKRDHIVFYKGFVCQETEESLKKKALAIMERWERWERMGSYMESYHLKVDGDNWKRWAIQDTRNVVYYVYKLEVADGSR